MIGGDEELGTSGAGGWFWRVVVGLVIAVVVAGVVVGLVRHHDSSPSAGPDASTPATHAGPVIPTFASVHPGPSADRSETFEIGPHHTRATLFGPARVLFASCVGSQCRARATVPEPVRRAVRTVVKGCSPVLTDLVRHRAGRSTLVERQAACVGGRVTLVVSVARLHSSGHPQTSLSGGTLVVGTHVHGPFTVQVFLQDRGGPLPKLSAARALARDPRLLAGS